MTAPFLPTLSPAGGAKASNLAFALRCLPRERQRDALVFYDFCRTVDDIADDPALPSAEKEARLAAWKEALAGNLPLPSPLETIIERHRLSRDLLTEIVRGCESDIHPQRYATFADLQKYCWRVASAVGLISIEIFGCREAASHSYAEALGYALQLTNILRDVGEDAKLGRIYLPMEDLEKFQVSDNSLLARQPDGDFVGLMKFEAARARLFFSEANRHFSAPDAQALIAAETMRRIYEKLLERMEADDFHVFAQTYRLSKFEKLLILVPALLGFPGRPAGASE